MGEPASLYEDALRAMERLLDLVGEHFWRDAIHEDIERWRESRGGRNRFHKRWLEWCALKKHLYKYGGMGSFNDILILDSQNTVTAAQEPWMNTLNDVIQSSCYELALKRGDRTAIEKTARFYERRPLFLTGWSCRNCRHPTVSPRGISVFLAESELPSIACRAILNSELYGLVDTVFDLRLPGIDRWRREVQSALDRSGIEVREEPTGMPTCPRCPSEETITYRWKRLSGDEPRFVPSDRNLPLMGDEQPAQ